MPYEVSWLIENHVAVSRFYEDVSADEIIAANTEILENFLVPAAGKIHCIYQVNEMANFPRNLSKLNEASRIAYTHKNLGYVILVGLNNPVLRMLTTAISQIGRVSMKETGTLDEALDILRRVDPNIPGVS